MLEIDAQQLLEGFVNSFNNLLRAAEPWVDRAQETHAILDYFRRLGWALGYYPWCEAGQRDLEWYGPKDAADEDYTQVVLHLESENDPTRLSQTIAKMVAAPADPVKAAHMRIALVWATVDARPALSGEDLALMQACSANQRGELLVIVRSTKEEAQPANIPQVGRSWLYPVKAWLARQGNCDPLDQYVWYILWPEAGGLQTAWWPQSPQHSRPGFRSARMGQ